MQKKILIIGSNSAIAKASARLWAAQGHIIYAVARDKEQLNTQANDLEIRGAKKVYVGTFEALNFDIHERVIHNAYDAMGGIDILLIAYGTLPNQKQAQLDSGYALRQIQINATSVINILNYAANIFEKQGYGSIAVISSVAGDRGRQSNYIYGCAKAMLSSFLQGLRNRLAKNNVSVITIKPGFVDTPMTAEFNKGLLWATADKVARQIIKAIDKQQDVVYTPKFWYCVMLVIKLIPEKVFKKMSL